jgi:hypothetical protein
MTMLKHLITVAIVSGVCAGAAIACFWWAGPETRRIAAIVAGVCSAAALEAARQQTRVTSGDVHQSAQSGG